MLFAAMPATAKTSAGGNVLTVDYYFDLQYFDNPQVSPDGEWFAYKVSG